MQMLIAGVMISNTLKFEQRESELEGGRRLTFLCCEQSLESYTKIV
jgi:hypothetical protein